VKKTIISFLLINLAVHFVHAQSLNLGSWNILNVKYNHTNHLSYFGETQLRSIRFYDQFHYYEFKGGVNYKPHKSVTFTVGAGSYQTYREGGNFKTPKSNDEFRLWPQITFFQEINAIKIEQRYRAELRWTTSGYRTDFVIDSAFPIHLENKMMATNPFLSI
jgi:hypothetical protein